MEYRQFPSLPNHLLLQIIRKCYPIPYVRLRQSCRFMDEFCEKNRKRLGIYCYRRDPHLYFGNEGVPYDYYRNRYRVDILWEGACFAINYGRTSKISNFTFEMTKENISRIRASLSGFGFTHLTVDTLPVFRTPNFGSIYAEAFKDFLKLASDFRIKYVTCSIVAHVKPMLKLWKLDSLEISHPLMGYSTIWEFLDIDGMKNVSCIEYENYYNNEDGQDSFGYVNIAKLVDRRRYIRIREARWSIKTIWNVLNWIYKDWKAAQNEPEEVVLEYVDDSSENWDPFQEATLRLPKEFTYIGEFRFEPKVAYSIWIIKLEKNESWRMLLIKRNHPEIVTSFFVKTVSSQSQMAEFLIEFIQTHFVRRVPLDVSTLYDYLITSETLEEMRLHICRELSILKPLYFAQNE